MAGACGRFALTLRKSSKSKGRPSAPTRAMDADSDGANRGSVRSAGSAMHPTLSSVTSADRPMSASTLRAAAVAIAAKARCEFAECQSIDAVSLAR